RVISSATTSIVLEELGIVAAAVEDDRVVMRRRCWSRGLGAARTCAACSAARSGSNDRSDLARGDMLPLSAAGGFCGFENGLGGAPGACHMAANRAGHGGGRRRRSMGDAYCSSAGDGRCLPLVRGLAGFVLPTASYSFVRRATRAAGTNDAS